MGFAYTYLAADPDRALDDCSLRSGMVRCGTIEEAVESAPWHWACDLRSGSHTILLGVVDAWQGEKEETIVRAAQSDGIYTTLGQSCDQC